MLFKSNVNRFPSLNSDLNIMRNFLNEHRKTEHYLFSFKAAQYNTFTVTSEELFVYKSEVSAINIGFFNKERDFVSLGNTEILL